MSEEEMAAEHRETFGHLIDITLDRDTLDAKKNRLVEVDREIDSIAADKAREVADYNERLKNKRKERTTLLDTISTGSAKLELQCYNERDDRRGMMLTRRVDTGEVVDERALTAEERNEDRQGDLFEGGSNAAPPMVDTDEPEEEHDADLEKTLSAYAAQAEVHASGDDDDLDDESDLDDEPLEH